MSRSLGKNGTARLVGHSVRIFAQKRISDAASQTDPLFASAYPAASIIPHSASLEADLIVNRLGAGASQVYEDIGPLHVDCLGFGGAGVTLSWGASIG
jgi:hypothetical protein